MLVMKPMRVVSVAAVSLVMGCGAGAASREDEAARLQAKHSFVQAVACLSPATQKECDPGLSAAFESPPTRSAAGRRKGSIWCEGGRPHARISAAPGEVAGEFGQVAWEAIWRVLKATDSCASAYGGAIAVTRNGQTHACKDPRFDMHELFDMAYGQAKFGPPPAVVRKTSDGICELDPGLCTISVPTPCPLFLGDPWNGVRAGRDEGAVIDLDGASEPDPGPDTAGDVTEPEGGARRPSQGEVTKALGAVLVSARKCVKGDGPTATATVVFQSDGAVQRVEVRGRGEPARACIEQALRRARVASFSDPSHEVTVTVRAHE